MAEDTPGTGLPALAAFEGRWTLARVIEDRRAGQTGRFTGTAVFSEGGSGLDYHESGELRLDGQTGFAAERRYRWQSGAGIEVYFEDGRFFHGIPGTGPRPEAEHLCGADLYRVAYDFSDWPVWHAAWTVLGPRKDYTMRSTYRRAG